MIFVSGQDSPLKLQVRAYPKEETMLSAKPAENTVGVVTETLRRWVFSPRQPEEAEEDLLWIVTGTASAGAFNALKYNGIELFPVEARQYREGQWQSVPARNYLAGSWIRWAADRKIYDAGVSHVNLTLVNAAKADGYLALSLGKNSTAKVVSDPVLLAGQARLVVQYRNLGGDGTFAGGIRARVWDSEDEVVASSGRVTGESGTIVLDISALSGEYKVGVFANNSSGSYEGTCRVTGIEIRMKAEE